MFVLAKDSGKHFTSSNGVHIGGGEVVTLMPPLLRGSVFMLCTCSYDDFYALQVIPCMKSAVNIMGKEF